MIEYTACTWRWWGGLKLAHILSFFDGHVISGVADFVYPIHTYTAY